MAVRRGLGPDPGALGERRSPFVARPSNVSRLPFDCRKVVSLLGVLGEWLGGLKENLWPQGVITLVCPHRRSSSAALIAGSSVPV